MNDKTSLQKFTIRPMMRSEIKLHPMNPRVISDSAKKKLKDVINEVGLLQPLIVNQTTGYLLGGHQRLQAMDSIERYRDGGKRDYSIEVSVVQLDEKQEAKMLVFLNNASAQGEWDTELLKQLTKLTSFDDMGFTPIDVDFLFDGELTRESAIGSDVAVVTEDKGTLAEIKRAKNDGRKSLQQANKADYTVTVVFKTADEKRAFMRKINVQEYEQFIVAEALTERLT